MALRYYQEDAIKADLDVCARDESPLTLMATGTGKTVVMAKVVETLVQKGKRVLIIAHRGLLLDQISKSLMDWAGLPSGREQSNEYANWKSSVILSTPQTLRGERLAKKPKGIDAVVIDECHRAVTPSMLELYDHFNDPMKLGYTATADRPDGKGLSDVFDQIAYQYSLARGVKDGYLAKIIGRRVTDMEIDLSNLRVKMGDYSDGDLGELLETHLVPIAHNVIKECEGRKKVLIFLPTVDSSDHLARILSEMGEEADYVSGEKGKGNGPVLAAFRSGGIRFLCSCQLVVEGYDEPGIDTIVMLRPTLSRIVYSQAIGRGTRLAPGKDHCLLVEFTYNSNKHKLVSPYELMGDNISERVVERAADASMEGDIDFLAVLEEMSTHQYNIKEIVERAIPKDFTFNSFNPLDVGDMVNVDLDSEAQVWFSGRQLKGGPTEKQVDLLSRFMINTTDLTKATASTLIGGLRESGAIPSRGWASSKQVRYLEHLYPGQNFPPGLTKAMAGVLITKAMEEKSAAM